MTLLLNQQLLPMRLLRDLQDLLLQLLIQRLQKTLHQANFQVHPDLKSHQLEQRLVINLEPEQAKPIIMKGLDQLVLEEEVVEEQELLLVLAKLQSCQLPSIRCQSRSLISVQPNAIFLAFSQSPEWQASSWKVTASSKIRLSVAASHPNVSKFFWLVPFRCFAPPSSLLVALQELDSILPTKQRFIFSKHQLITGLKLLFELSVLLLELLEPLLLLSPKLKLTFLLSLLPRSELVPELELEP